MTRLLAVGSLFAVENVLGNIVLSKLNDPAGTSVSSVRQWTGPGAVIAAFGMIAFYPTGRP